MKKGILLVVLLFLLFFINCSSKNTKKDDNISKNISTKIVELMGKLEVYPQKNDIEVYIVENWTTKSCVSYRVKNYKKVIEKKGLILKVKAKLYPMKSPYSGEIEVIKVLEIIKQAE